VSGPEGTADDLGHTGVEEKVKSTDHMAKEATKTVSWSTIVNKRASNDNCKEEKRTNSDWLKEKPTKAKPWGEEKNTWWRKRRHNTHIRGGVRNMKKGKEPQRSKDSRKNTRKELELRTQTRVAKENEHTLKAKRG